MQHALSSGHKNVADVVKGRKRGQSMFVFSVPKPFEKTIPEANNNVQPSVKNFVPKGLGQGEKVCHFKDSLQTMLGKVRR